MWSRYIKAPFKCQGIQILDSNNVIVADLVGNDGLPDVKGTKVSQLPGILACINKQVDGIFNTVIYTPHNVQISAVFNGVEWPLLKLKTRVENFPIHDSLGAYLAYNLQIH